MLSSTAIYTLLALPLIPVVYLLFGVYRWLAIKYRIAAIVDQLPGPEREPFFGNMRQVLFNFFLW